METISCHSNQSSYPIGTKIKNKKKNNYSCPLPIDAICEIWNESAARLQRRSRLKMLTDGRTTDTISSSMSLRLRWANNIYSLGVFTEKPYSKLLERNEVYIPIITLSQATSHDFKWCQNKPWLSTIWLDVGDVMTSLTLFRCSQKNCV